ncbi:MULTISPECIES: hypothetical protein [Sphingomonas]|uniref:hypothetical protein n=1 Tax=Sphingomonas TaxID=13687 RepID=UPI001F529754|nr:MULTISPECIES: hypothetical protein [Sphingomonas]
MDRNDDGPAIFSVGARRILSQRRAERIRDGNAALVVDKANATSLIQTPFGHANLAHGAHGLTVSKHDHRRIPTISGSQ